jgi:hypothetical protein
MFPIARSISSARSNSSEAKKATQAVVRVVVVTDVVLEHAR